MATEKTTSKTSYKIPRVITNERVEDEDYQKAYAAALKHGKQLSKAEYDIEVARDLCETLRGYLIHAHSDDSFTAGTVVELIEKRIRKARQRLDMHSSDHKNLFIAYCDLKRELSQ